MILQVLKQALIAEYQALFCIQETYARRFRTDKGDLQGEHFASRAYQLPPVQSRGHGIRLNTRDRIPRLGFQGGSRVLGIELHDD